MYQFLHRGEASLLLADAKSKASIHVVVQQVLQHLLVVAVGDALLERASNNNIRVVDGSALVDWIYGHLSKLKPETKAKLGICDVPSLLGS